MEMDNDETRIFTNKLLLSHLTDRLDESLIKTNSFLMEGTAEQNYDNESFNQYGNLAETL